jgi:hypothetical protein
MMNIAAIIHLVNEAVDPAEWGDYVSAHSIVGPTLEILVSHALISPHLRCQSAQLDRGPLAPVAVGHHS